MRSSFLIIPKDCKLLSSMTNLLLQTVLELSWNIIPTALGLSWIKTTKLLLVNKKIKIIIQMDTDGLGSEKNNKESDLVSSLEFGFDS